MAKILVVDDRPENRELLVTLLGYQHHELYEASDGEEALVLAQRHRPDLVITDVLMPTMDGYELVRQLRADAEIAGTAVIFCTAYYHEGEARSLARACGVSHLLTKPVDPRLVLRTVDEALGLAPAEPTAPPGEEFDRQHLRLVTDKLSQQAAELRAVNQRLAELIEINLQLAAENDIYRQLENLCRSARNLVGARYAAAGISSRQEEKPEYFVISGMDLDASTAVGEPSLRSGLLGTLLDERRTFRLSRLEGDPEDVGLPARFPSVHTFLGAPIASMLQAYGWLCLSNKLGGEEFSEEDERLMTLLTAHFGRLFENRSLYDNLQRKAVELEHEVAERRKAELAVWKLNRELEERVAERTAQLEAANRELEAFSYSVSHDLRAPLRAIDGFAALLVEDFPQLPAQAMAHLHRVRANARRMGNLIDDLLAFSRLSQQPVHRIDVDLATLFAEALEELRRGEPERALEVTIEPLPPANADPSLIRQVVVNLLSNALKFTRGREPARIVVGFQPGPPEGAYFVRDNGVGFDMRQADTLFGVFQRLHRAEEFEGTGVGLSLVQRIVQRHGGRIWPEAAPGEGATFYFTLPD
jgi:signal transduction histidine kinase/DNA-binding response OmpR family regulator